MNKLSKYNFFVENGKNTILYNAASDQRIAVLPQLADLVDDNKDNIDKLQEIHPDFYKELVARGFIVSEEIDETAEVVRRCREIESSPQSYSITILPTLDCNCRCWYCYEKHNAGTTMKPETVELVKKHIDIKLSSPEMKYFNLGFFGGEPLMGFNNVVMPLLSYSKQRCEEKGIKFDAHFTTNATLLTDKMTADMKSLEVPISFQITLDGNREAHDSVRCTRFGKPTFDVIVKNVHKLLKNQFKVSLRVNYTNENIDTTSDIVDEFKDLTEEEKSFFDVDFQQVWQDAKNNRVRSGAHKDKVVTNFQKQKLYVQPFTSRLIRCYADCENKIVINYNGDIYKCTARDFTPENREGVLCEDGHIEYNDKYRYRMRIKHTNKVCLACNIYPLCHGACTQNDMENPNRNYCLYGYNNETKKEIVSRRLSSR